MSPDTLSREAEAILASLVAFDSVSQNGNQPIIGHIEAMLRTLGIGSLRIDYEPGLKTNLLARIGPDVAGGVVLSGHTDVVPVAGQPWTRAPFSLTREGERLYGRGTCDMKGFLACMLAMAPLFKASPLKRPVYLAFSCDEEVGCRGVGPLVAHLAAHAPRPSACIVGEPTLMSVVDAHKAVMTFATEVTGLDAHSSLTDRGVNAIVAAARMIVAAETIAEDFRRRGDASQRFDPPYSTLHVGLVSGGIAKNIVPRHCEFMWETRLLPGADRQEAETRMAEAATALIPAMQAVAPEAGIVTSLINAVPGLAPDPGGPAEALAFQLTGANATSAVSYATEAGHFQAIGIPTVICGPGSIAQAHTADEFIARAELTRCLAMLARLKDSLTR